MAGGGNIEPSVPLFTDDDIKNFSQLSIRDDTFFYLDAPNEFVTDEMLQYSVRDIVGMESAEEDAGLTPLTPGTIPGGGPVITT